VPVDEVFVVVAVAVEPLLTVWICVTVVVVLFVVVTVEPTVTVEVCPALFLSSFKRARRAASSSFAPLSSSPQELSVASVRESRSRGKSCFFTGFDPS
jgi:hypothetical protein